jgi:cyclic 2,3-diphosphoglycerate synthetase
MAEEAWLGRAATPAAEFAPRVLVTTLRPRPVERVEGRTVAFFSTAPQSAHGLLAAHLCDDHGADVVHVSGNLSDRRALLEELKQIEAEVYLVELKAAAIDVVAEAARERGVDVVLAGSDVLSVDGQDSIGLLRLAEEAYDE